MATRIGLEPTTPSVTGWCSNQLSYRAKKRSDVCHSHGAADEARTRYLHLGKVALYQMSYGRIWCLDTGIFSPLLYQLSYRGAPDVDYYTAKSKFVKRKMQIFSKNLKNNACAPKLFAPGAADLLFGRDYG